MTNQLTDNVQRWLEADPDSRSHEEGALLLLQLTENRLQFLNLSRDTPENRMHLEYQLQKHLCNRRPQAAAELERQAEEAVQRNIPGAAQRDAEPRQRGRRADHDSLPDKVKAAFTENYNLLQQMRQLHLKLRSVTAPDNEPSARLADVRRIVALDKRLHENWKLYDSWPTSN